MTLEQFSSRFVHYHRRMNRLLENYLSIHENFIVVRYQLRKPSKLRRQFLPKSRRNYRSLSRLETVLSMPLDLLVTENSVEQLHFCPLIAIIIVDIVLLKSLIRSFANFLFFNYFVWLVVNIVNKSLLSVIVYYALLSRNSRWST